MEAAKPFADENQMKNGITGAVRLSVILASVCRCPFKMSFFTCHDETS
jgi:hypothetical protein